MAKELVTNANWLALPLDDMAVTAIPDDDLFMPAIDEWAGGVLPVRDADATGLRTAVTVASESKRSTGNSVKPLRGTAPLATEVLQPVAPPAGAAPRSARTAAAANATKPRVRPPPSEGEVLLKTFEEIRKKSTVSTKAVTVDAEFNVIQIQEPHGLPSSLIVPKITMKKPGKVEGQAAATTRAPRPPIKKPEPTGRRRPPGRFIELDTPKFDTEIAEVTFADKIICAPGVTFRDGGSVKSRPPLHNANQLTRAQYEVYLEEMKRAADMS
jgi:hypothetical protein